MCCASFPTMGLDGSGLAGRPGTPRLPGVRAWLSAKLQAITAEYIGGDGYGDVYESTFLAYLECLVAARKGDPGKVWTAHLARVDAIRGEEPAQPLNRLLPDRQALVDELKALERQLVGGPVSKQFIAPKQAKALDEGPDILDMFGPD